MLLREALHQGPDLAATAPASDIASPIEAIGTLHDANACMPDGDLDPEMLASAVESTVDFARDRDTGLPALYAEILRILEEQEP